MKAARLVDLPRVKDGEAWLFGKGPSLDRVDWDTVGEFRLCQNDSIIRVPGATAMLSMDYWPHLFDGPQSFDAISPRKVTVPGTMETDKLRVPEDWTGRYIQFTPQRCRTQWERHVRKYGRLFYLENDTLPYALGASSAGFALCWVMGAEVVHGWGFDGTGAGRAAGFHDWPTPSVRHYDRVLEQIGYLEEITGCRFVRHGVE